LDQITIKALEYEAKHGYYEEERSNGNRFEVDITGYGSFTAAAAHDNDLDVTFNYERAESIASEIMRGESKKMIETLCYDIGGKIFEEFTILKQLKVSVRKLNPPIQTNAAYAEVTLKWQR